ncbi:MAG: hypothetical protein HY905_14420 [Deltaproteobacteria bacterium]|nr:hypothetical protein [Deltaproteobacteria bacterium]
MHRAKMGWAAAAAAAGLWAAGTAGGCPEPTTTGGPCEPGETRLHANACGVCATGARVQTCDDRREWVDGSCEDPFDGDGDTYANGACETLVGGCCTSRIDCDDADPAVHPDPLVCAAGATEPCTTDCGTAGRRTCSDACVWDDCRAGHDQCNGIDDDCDGDTDEDAACTPGSSVPCTTVCGSRGTGDCTTECLPPLGLDCAPPDEACNRADDDCDGDTDEEFPCIAGARVECTTSCGSTGHGTCSTTCAPPAAGACSPPSERCDNGEDDDCDGDTDELEPGQCVPGTTVACGTSCGSTGNGVCTAGCLPPSGAACLPPHETCNRVDDDCDGAADEDFACLAGATLECSTSCGSLGTGTCAEDCTPPAAADCTPPHESCGDGVDDDCDGLTDEGCSGAGESCADPIVLDSSMTEVAVDLCPRGDDGEGSCGPSTGPDAVYTFTLPVGGLVVFNTCNDGSAADTVLYLRSTCADPGTELGCNDDLAGCPHDPGGSYLSIYLAAGSYFLFVDAPAGTCASLRLDLAWP